jgi:hypothetical protein
VGGVSALAGLCGAGIGLGLLLALAGWRGVDLPRQSLSRLRPKVERVNLRLGLAVFNRGFLAPYDTATGQLVLLLVGAVFAASFLWLAKMTRPTTTDRMLAKHDGFQVPDRTSGIAS